MIPEVFHSLVEASQFDIDDFLYGVEVELVKGDYLVQAVEELWRELLGETLLDDAASIFLVLLVHRQSCAASVESHSAAELLQLSCSGVAGHYDYRVAEVDKTTVAIGQTTFVEHLQQHVEHVAVSLFYLVEKHDGVGLAAHLFGELSAFLISHVSRRRTHKARGVETLGVLTHVYAYQGILRTEHLLGKFLCKISLAHTRRT